jgi:hypothetical protein
MKTYLVSDCDHSEVEMTYGQVWEYLTSVGVRLDRVGVLEGTYRDVTGDDVEVTFWDEKD